LGDSDLLSQELNGIPHPIMIQLGDGDSGAEDPCRAY